MHPVIDTIIAAQSIVFIDSFSGKSVPLRGTNVTRNYCWKTSKYSRLRYRVHDFP